MFVVISPDRWTAINIFAIAIWPYLSSPPANFFQTTIWYRHRFLPLLNLRRLPVGFFIKLYPKIMLTVDRLSSTGINNTFETCFSNPHLWWIVANCFISEGVFKVCLESNMRCVIVQEFDDEQCVVLPINSQLRKYVTGRKFLSHYYVLLQSTSHRFSFTWCALYILLVAKESDTHTKLACNHMVVEHMKAFSYKSSLKIVSYPVIEPNNQISTENLFL